MSAELLTRSHVAAAAIGAAVAAVTIWVAWNLLWAEATERAYGRRWDDE